MYIYIMYLIINLKFTADIKTIFMLSKRKKQFFWGGVVPPLIGQTKLPREPHLAVLSCFYFYAAVFFSGCLLRGFRSYRKFVQLCKQTFSSVYDLLSSRCLQRRKGFVLYCRRGELPFLLFSFQFRRSCRSERRQILKLLKVVECFQEAV